MNQDYLEKIEAYLNNEMSPADRSQFEATLTLDKELANTLKMYRTIEADMRGFEKYKLQDKALQATLSTFTKEYFTDEAQSVAKVIPLYSSNIFKIVAGLAASVVIFLVTYFTFLLPAENLPALADTYVKENLQQINQSVSVPEDTLHFGVAGNHQTKNTYQDSVATGITAYNNQEFNTALRYFQGVQKNHPDDKAVKKYTGLVYLRTKKYEQALQAFQELARSSEVPNNPGLFLQAITFMLRNQPHDKQQAKQRLQQVVETRAAGSQQAAAWLEKL